ncbi:hypothetical protein Leryth_005033 [Lithospermum erythrorhizon]|nr:hypothetical protein Leryth_005033 [Lithospermum erythrorhizon]
MLAVPPSRNIINKRNNQMASFSIMKGEDFLDFSSSTDCNLLDSIDFDQLFDVGINEGDVLPDLEMDSEILAEFSLSGSEDSDMNFPHNFPQDSSENHSRQEGEVDFVDNKHSASDLGSTLSSINGEDNNNGVSQACQNLKNPSSYKEASHKGKKSSNNSAKNAQGKKKVKVDWTPELHKRFVEAVEQLGVDKAVPSRILELMGIECLTRHNIASHLQKYRSHRKHMVAREAEAANWNQRRQLYSAPPPTANGGKRDKPIHWVAPTIGFPPVAPMPPHFRPLHVWGHPSVDQSLLHMWPKHRAPTPSPRPAPPPSWPPLQSPMTPSFWHSNHQHGFAPPPPIQRFPTQPVPGIPPPTMFKVDPSITLAVGQNIPKPPLLDLQPTKESIDAALGDVLAKPWLPLPLGLRPPSTDSVLGALQRQGVSKIPPTSG